MQNTGNLCMGCMKDIGDAEICPHCGYRDDRLQTAPFLPPHTWLQDRYLVGKLLSHDGEGATYMGWDNVMQSPIMIREFLPVNMFDRKIDESEVTPKPEYADVFAKHLNSFLELSRALARMRDLSALLPVYDIFELNGTGYRISEYVESITFEDFLKRNGNVLTFEQTRSVLMPILGTLSSLHNAGIIHGGICPQNLLVGKDGKLRLDGFATEALHDSRSDLESQLFDGYSAIEQYGFEGRRGPQTDIYAFAAVIYRTLVGSPPMDSKSRATSDRLTIPTDISKTLPQHALAALANALQVMPDDRIDSVDEFRDEFSATAPASTLRTAPIAQTKSENDDSEKSASVNDEKKRSLTYTLVAMGATMVVLIIIFVILNAKLHIFGGSVKSEASELEFASAVSYIDPGMNQKVPDITGMTYDQAISKYGSIFDFSVSAKEYSREYAAGEIIKQSLDAGTEIPADASNKTAMSVVLSLGSSSASIPDVSGMSYEQAFVKLATLGFSPNNIKKVEKYSDSVSSGKVIETTPPKGTKDYSVDREITIYVSNSPTVSTSPSSSTPSSNSGGSNSNSSSSSNSSPVESTTSNETSSNSTDSVQSNNE